MAVFSHMVAWWPPGAIGSIISSSNSMGTNYKNAVLELLLLWPVWGMVFPPIINHSNWTQWLDRLGLCSHLWNPGYHKAGWEGRPSLRARLKSWNQKLRGLGGCLTDRSTGITTGRSIWRREKAVSRHSESCMKRFGIKAGRLLVSIQRII